MKVLGFYLWKEWREFRSIAIGIAVAVPLLLFLTGALVPEAMFVDKDTSMGFGVLGALGALAIALFSLTTDLFAGERRRNRIVFLDRLPAGLRAPFFAKAIVFVIGTSLPFLYGFVMAAWVAEWRGGSSVTLFDLVFYYRYFPQAGWFVRPVVLLSVTLVWGVLPVACMAPRGVLTLPLTALLIAVFVGVFVAFVKYAGVSGSVLDNRFEGPMAFALIALAIGTAAYLAFVRGYRAGGGWLRATRWALVILGVAYIVPLVPLARAAMVANGWIEGEPRIVEVLLSGDGNTAYVERYTKMGKANGVLLHARRIDLRTGEVTELDARTVSTAMRGWEGQQPVWHPYVRLDGRIIDSVTGLTPGLDQATILRKARRAATPFRTPEGGRLWTRGEKIVVENPDGVTRLIEAEDPLNGFPNGFGIHSFNRGIFDVPRQQYFSMKSMKRQPRFIRVRPGRWIVRQNMMKGPWMLLDPETWESAPAKGIGEREYVCAIHDDGRVFVVRAAGQVTLVDPETGESTELSDGDGLPVKVMPSWYGLRDASRFGRVAARTPNGARVFMLDSSPARFDAESNSLVRCKVRFNGSTTFVGCVNEHVAHVLVGDWAIYRVEFGTPTATLVYAEK